MPICADVLTIALSCLALALGATWLVNAAARLAKRFGVSELVIGLTVVAFGTSAPEFAATISAALQGNEDISVGNVVGSNIFNVGFILGGCALVRAIPTRKSLVYRDGLLLLLSSATLYLMLLSQHLSRLEGLILAAALFAYLLLLFYKRDPVLADELPTGPARSSDLPLLLAGLTLVSAGGYFLVQAASNLAHAAGISDWVIALTVVAAATSMPEFVVSLAAILKKHHGISAGNLVGSCLFNTFGVLGVAALLRPLAVEQTALISTLLLTGLSVLVLVVLRTRWRVTRLEGALLFLAGLTIWIFTILQTYHQQQPASS